MTRYIAIWSLKRGRIDREPLSDVGQYAANLEAEHCDAQDDAILRRRATAGYQLERDPAMNSTRAKCA